MYHIYAFSNVYNITYSMTNLVESKTEPIQFKSKILSILYYVIST